MSAKFGSLFKKHRLAAGMTLREFCLKHGFDPGNLSRLERGRFSPPQSHEKLTEYAMALGVESGSDAWQEFFDVAAVELGRIPPALLSDAELAGKLPVLFCTMRARQVSSGKLDDLMDKIQKS